MLLTIELKHFPGYVNLMFLCLLTLISTVTGYTDLAVWCWNGNNRATFSHRLTVLASYVSRKISQISCIIMEDIYFDFYG
ncbi:hypothetical protein MIMGU_mgv1a017359mg [Erythranthe guttata]|uniref:Uncharacterized protein n=1 Tax=Erythranthe guttata TaxID=4155 RepID=A0A022QGB0_ERYGU|nr:hypothetical protein MIMGU_mgv1a017359mg [Erythranthe guttata]